jgi:ribosomal protein S18 acetylase RimI-like enzyme
MSSSPHQNPSFFEKAVSSLRREGPRVFAQKAAAKCGLRRLILLECDLAQMPPSTAPSLPLEFRLLRSSEVDDYLASEPEMDRAQTEKELATGGVCVLALSQGQIAGSMWVARDRMSLSWGHVRRDLARDEAYLFGAHTATAFRRRGINNALSHHLTNWLGETGVRRLYRMVFPWNLPALAAHRKAGFHACGQFVSIGIGRFRRGLFIPMRGGQRA